MNYADNIMKLTIVSLVEIWPFSMPVAMRGDETFLIFPNLSSINKINVLAYVQTIVRCMVPIQVGNIIGIYLIYL